MWMWLLIRPPTRIKNWQTELATASCFQLRRLHHWAGSNTELVTCTACRSKICFGQFLWRVRGKHTRASPRNYSPCPEKTGACYTGYWAGCPIIITCCLIWVDGDEFTLSLFRNRLGTNKSRWCGLSVFSELYNREGMVSGMSPQ